MRILTHDLEPSELRRILPSLPEDFQIIEPGEREPACCVGCFGCWLKTPGRCVIRDGWGDLSPLLGRSSEYVIVSRVVYGGLSPFVKAILDRNIGYMLPYFTKRNGEMHHVSRYPDRIRLTVVGYGAGLTAAERDAFRGIAAANGLNLAARETRAYLLEGPSELAQLKEVFA